VNDVINFKPTLSCDTKFSSIFRAMLLFKQEMESSTLLRTTSLFIVFAFIEALFYSRNIDLDVRETLLRGIRDEIPNGCSTCE